MTAALLRASYDAHRARRDRLRSLVADRDETPVAAEAGYDVDAEDRSAVTWPRSHCAPSSAAPRSTPSSSPTPAGQRRWASRRSPTPACALSLGGRPET